MLLKSVHNFSQLKKNNYKLIIKIVYQNHQVKTTFFYAIKDLKTHLQYRCRSVALVKLFRTFEGLNIRGAEL
jgi:hypothetical protein